MYDFIFNFGIYRVGRLTICELEKQKNSFFIKDDVSKVPMFSNLKKDSACVSPKCGES